MGDDEELTDHERGWAHWFMTDGSHRKRKRRFSELNNRERDVLHRFVREHITYMDEYLLLLRHSIHKGLVNTLGKPTTDKMRKRGQLP